MRREPAASPTKHEMSDRALEALRSFNAHHEMYHPMCSRMADLSKLARDLLGAPPLNAAPTPEDDLEAVGMEVRRLVARIASLEKALREIAEHDQGSYGGHLEAGEMAVIADFALAASMLWDYGD